MLTGPLSQQVGKKTARGTANKTARGTANKTARGTANKTARGTANKTSRGTDNKKLSELIGRAPPALKREDLKYGSILTNLLAERARKHRNLDMVQRTTKLRELEYSESASGSEEVHRSKKQCSKPCPPKGKSDPRQVDVEQGTTEDKVTATESNDSMTKSEETKSKVQKRKKCRSPPKKKKCSPKKKKCSPKKKKCPPKKKKCPPKKEKCPPKKEKCPPKKESHHGNCKCCKKQGKIEWSDSETYSRHHDKVRKESSEESSTSSRRRHYSYTTSGSTSVLSRT